MKYIIKILAIVFYLICMFVIFLWHFNFKHFQSYNKFWDDFTELFNNNYHDT